MSIPVRDFLKARRDRALGSILGYAESNVYDALEDYEQRALRKAVIDAINSYHDSVLDLVKSDDGGVRNDEVIEFLYRLEQKIDAR
jgi:hypothetical protein